MANDVELRDVTKRYGAVVALDGLSLDVRQGEFLALLGPSGGGKSTTLRLIGGFLSPDRGSITLRGRPIADVPAHARETATVFQSYALFPHLTIGDNVGYGLQQQGLGRADIAQRVREALTLVALPGTERRRPHELSGGQQQRVALARSLAVAPAVLLLDEPLGALDVSLRRQMQGELRDIQRRLGITFIYVTHDQDEALSMSDRMAVLRAGRIEQVGTPQELYDRPDNVFVAGFMGAGNLLTGTVLGLDGDVVTVDAGGVRLMASGLGTAALVPGATVPVMIRPERLAVVPSGDATATWTGRVTQSRYHGALTSLTVTTAGGTALLVSVPAGHGAVPAIGDEAGVRVTTGGVVLVGAASS